MGGNPIRRENSKKSRRDRTEASIAHKEMGIELEQEPKPKQHIKFEKPKEIKQNDKEYLWLIDLYNELNMNDILFTVFLIGTKELKDQIIAGADIMKRHLII